MLVSVFESAFFAWRSSRKAWYFREKCMNAVKAGFGFGFLSSLLQPRVRVLYNKTHSTVPRWTIQALAPEQ